MNLQVFLKKMFAALMVVTLFTAVKCENEPLDEDFFDDQNNNCVGSSQAAINAGLNFVEANSDNYSQLCTAYKTALEAEILACGDAEGTLQATLNTLGNCPVIQDDCEAATVAASVVQIAFNGSTEENVSQLCKAYKLALQNKITVCGDDNSSIQTAINQLGNCTNGQIDFTIPGTWLLTAWNIDGGLDLDNNGTATTNILEEMDCYNNETLVFNVNGTASIISTSFAEIVVEVETGTINSFDYTINCEEDNRTSSGTWSINQNIVTFSFDDFDEQIEMTRTDDELSYFLPEGFSAQSDDGSIEIMEDMTVVYTKQ